MKRALILAVVAACNKAPPPASSQPPGDARPSAVAVAPDAAPAADCDAALAPMAKWISSAFVAKDRTGPYEQIHEAWPQVPEACRNGRWYLYAAKLVGPARVFEAPGVKLATRDQALAAALAQPPDLDVLVYVAFTGALGGATRLPADACATAQRVAGPHGADRARYVCGHAALAAGDAKTASEQLGAIVEGRFPDLDLRRAEAALALGQKKQARDLAKKAATQSYQSAAVGHATSADHAAIVAAAKALSKR